MKRYDPILLITATASLVAAVAQLLALWLRAP